mmetsp:Transcript_27704/g.61172  ORF Transcript_27704/g.61172 Transcript_27704/m.61172 type:complete len:186 (-) Transcript_27704:672-1229(-)
MEDVLLDVWYAVTTADFFDKRRRLLVTQHRKIWPHVVLNLVVEPPMEKVDSVGSHAVVNTCQHLTKEKGTRKRSATLAKSVHVIASVVGDDSEKSVCVGQKFSQKKVLYTVPVKGFSVTQVFAQSQKRKRCDEEMEHQVWKQDNHHQFTERVEEATFSEKSTLESNLFGRVDIGGNFNTFATKLR